MVTACLAVLTAPQVADFGFAKHFATDTMATLAGTWHYVAPEVIDAEVDLGGYGPAADLWSVGVLTYQLLSGSLPFDGSVAQLVEQISRARFSFPPELFDNVSDEAKDFVRCLLVRHRQRARVWFHGRCTTLLTLGAMRAQVTDPNDRMTAAQALQHRSVARLPGKGVCVFLCVCVLCVSVRVCGGSTCG